MSEKEAFFKDKHSYLIYISVANDIHVLDSVHLV